MKEKEIHGLLLVGGRSQRMGADKALLRFNGREPQIQHAAELLGSVCPKVFISLRREQAFPIPKGTAPLHDSVNDVHGPLCGILSAMQAYPEAHWLVLACDLPFLRRPALEKLIRGFHAAALHPTAYRSAHDGLPEPLCALYPAGFAQPLEELARDLGKHCPRKLLIQANVQLIDQDDPHSLDNINTPEEFAAASRA
ncbi:MAG: molybdenum cofactor guanylyltransferase [Coraliomargarita sp.]